MSSPLYVCPRSFEASLCRDLIFDPFPNRASPRSKKRGRTPEPGRAGGAERDRRKREVLDLLFQSRVPTSTSRTETPPAIFADLRWFWVGKGGRRESGVGRSCREECSEQEKRDEIDEFRGCARKFACWVGRARRDWVGALRWSCDKDHITCKSRAARHFPAIGMPRSR